MYSNLPIILLAVAFGQALTGSEAGSIQSSNYAIDIHAANGLHLQFPHFSSSINSQLRPQISNKLRDVAIEIMQYLDHLIEDMLLNKVPFGKWFSVSGDLYKITAKIPREGLELGSKIGYNKYILNVVSRMMTESKRVEKNLKATGAPKNPKKLAEELHKPIQGLIEAMRASPDSIYIAWADGKIDNVHAEKVAIDLMGKMRYHGFSGLLSTVEHVLNVILMFSKIG